MRAAAVVALTLLRAGGVYAQEPQEPEPSPADSSAVEVPDSVPVPPDSLAADSLAADSAAADSVRPVPEFPRFPDETEAGGTAGVWEWDREALLASGAFSLTDLLERIPGVSPLRSGYFGLPEAVSTLGLTGGRLEVVLDGYVLDPLDGATYDLSRLELSQLRRVRVRRRGNGVRVELETLSPTDSRPYSAIEAATGDLETDLLRGIFLAPRVLGGPLSLGIDRLETDGAYRRENAVNFAGWLKWGLVFGSSGLQLEYRRHRNTREATAALPGVVGTPGWLGGEVVREDWVLRARAAPMEHLMTEAFVGVSSLEKDTLTTAPDSAEPAVTERSVQSGLRALYRTDRYWAGGTLRLRSHRALPSVDGTVSAGVHLPASLTLSGEARTARWPGGTQATSYTLRSEVAPLPGLSTFAEVSGGRAGVPFLEDTTGLAVLTDRTTVRVGSEFARGGLRGGAAAVFVRADSIPSFGLPFDQPARLFPAGQAQGWEATLRVPLGWRPLALEGAYTRWMDDAPWLYRPQESWRAALVYHHLPLESGNLELRARLEGHHRGAMLVPGLEGELEQVPAITAFDLYLQIRVLSVRAYLRWENFTHQLDLYDLPDRLFPGQRVLYGVKWEFWN